MRPLRRNPEGRGFPGDLLCRAARPWGLPWASRRFAHLIPESRRRGHAGLVQRFLGRLRPAHAVDAKAGQYLHNSREPGLQPRQTGRWRGRYNAKRQPKLPFGLIRKAETSRCRFLARVTLAEFLDAACGVDDLLFACIERVACRAHFDVQRLVDRRARRKRVAAAARHLDFAVLRMDTGFHRAPVRWGRPRP